MSSSFQLQDPRKSVVGVLLPNTWSEWTGRPPDLSSPTKARQEVREFSGRHGQ